MKDCSNFNPFVANALFSNGLEQRELYRVNWDKDGNPIKDTNGKIIYIDDDREPVEYDESGNAINPLSVKMICTESNGEKGEMLIELDNHSTQTRLNLQVEDGEIDDYLKIYTNYVRVDDGHGDWHYDLYFNI